VRRSLALALVAVFLLSQAGCAPARSISPVVPGGGPDDPRREHLPPPPSEDLRSQIRGRFRLSGGGDPPTALQLSGPARGAGQGAARGALLGGLVPGVLCEVGPLCVFYWFPLFPVGALVGSVVGAIWAPSVAQVEEEERALRLAMEKFPETFARRVADTLVTSVGPTSQDGSASTILEVVIERFGLDGPPGVPLINPPLAFFVTERTRLIRASAGTELYGHWLTYRGRERPIEYWTSQNYAMLREEAERASRELAERLVDEVFLLYLSGDGGRSAQ
jgi:hypothetical protein